MKKQRKKRVCSWRKFRWPMTIYMAGFACPLPQRCSLVFPFCDHCFLGIVKRGGEWVFHVVSVTAAILMKRSFASKKKLKFHRSVWTYETVFFFQLLLKCLCGITSRYSFLNSFKEVGNLNYHHTAFFPSKRFFPSESQCSSHKLMWDLFDAKL